MIVDQKDEKINTKIIEVKASQTQQKFLMVKEIPLKNNYFIIILDYENKLHKEKPDVYILKAVDWFDLMMRFITKEVNEWRIKTRREKRKCKVKGPNDRTIRVHNYLDCDLREIKERP